MNKEISDRIDRALWRAFAGKLSGAWPHWLAMRIKWLAGLAGNEKEQEEALLSQTCLNWRERIDGRYAKCSMRSIQCVKPVRSLIGNDTECWSSMRVFITALKGRQL